MLEISVIIPAFNEEKYLAATLVALTASIPDGIPTELIVVDNGSTDGTALVALERGAGVVSESVRNIGRVRNTGARASSGRVLVFVDADTLVPPQLLSRIYGEAETCLGGAVATDYHPRRLSMRLYLGLWRVFGQLLGMAQGATQFCRREAFDQTGGYDESLFMGEDTDFFFRLRKHARRQGSRVRLIDDIRVVPSTRRFDQWSIWKALVWTNPLLIALLMRTRSAWKSWYDKPPR